MNKTISLQKRVLAFTKFTAIHGLLAVMFMSMSYGHIVKGQEVLETKIVFKATNESIKSVLRKIEKQASVTFAYKAEFIKNFPNVTLQKDSAKLKEILDAIFENRASYEVIKNHILLTENPKHQGGIVAPTSSLAFEVSGVVRGEENAPLPGVNVTLKGSTTGTATDAEGKFVLSVPEANAILVFSFIGYQSEEVAVGNRSVINVSLVPTLKSLSEVVVVGYGQQKKASVTGSVATVKGESLVTAPMSNISNTLAGRLPGLVSKQESGEPGNDAASISIRGFGPALTIVDGVQLDIANLDPNTIESVTILKDASAAIYGARAGNGVILITTKRGKIGKPTIAITSSYSLQGITRGPRPVNAGQYAELMREAQLNSGQAPDFTAEEVTKYYAGTDPNYPNTDWRKVVLRDQAPMQQYGISLSGGSENITYRGSLNTINQEGLYKSGDNTYKRYNLVSNLDAKVSKNVSISLDLLGTSDLTKAPSRPQENFWADFYDAQPIYPASLPDPNKLAYAGAAISPILNTYRKWGGYNDRMRQTIKTTFSLTYKLPIEGLSLKGVFNFNQYTEDTKIWSKSQSLYAYNYNTKEYTLKSSTPATNLNQTYYKSRVFTPQLFLNYQRTFGSVHDVTGLLLYESQDFLDGSISGTRQNYLSNAIDQIFAGGQQDQKINGTASQYARKSYIGRVNYAFKNKYLLEVSGRYDASVNFPKNKRWSLFPSVSVGWRLNEEAFASKLNWLTTLKLRASYSKTGYDATGSFQYLTGYTFSDPYLFNGLPSTGVNSTGLANTDITWETMKTANLGVDYAFLNGKIYGEFDIFRRDRTGMLANRLASLPSTFGATLPAENINSQLTHGFEFSIGTRGKLGGFGYDISGNVSRNRTKWTHFDEPDYTDPDQIRINQQTGKYVGTDFGYVSNGLFTSQEEINSLGFDQDGQGNKSLHPGDIRYVDLNGNGKLDIYDQKVIGQGTVPQMIWGLNMAFNYKNFDLSWLIQGAAKYNVSIKLGIDSRRTPYTVLYDERWTPENNDRDAIVPRQTFGTTENNNRHSDYWTKDASYARLKTISLGYTFPTTFLRKILIDKVRIYVSGTNLLTIDGISRYGIDPEIASTPNATRGWYYPQQRTVSAGLNLSF